MMTRHFVLACLLLAACSKKKEDKCTRAIDKSWTVLNEIAVLRGKNAKLTPEDKKAFVENCRKASKSKPDPEVDCVLAAKDDAGVRDCYMKGYEAYLARSKEMEAKIQLGKIAKTTKAAFIGQAAFPTGKVGPTPATPCCSEQVKQCLPGEGTFSDPTWQALEFMIEGPFHFQYSYESNGKTFTATASGDPGCTGKPVTHTITGKVGADGSPEITGPTMK